MPHALSLSDPPFAPLLKREPLLCLEDHKVVTKDGYILTLSRVLLRDRSGEYLPIHGEPVLLGHGLLCQGSHWLLNHEEKCLPYILGKSGFDCWIANMRGTELSKEHEILDAEAMEFWDFSWDDIARFDIPALINHVLLSTGKPQLFYVGHSLGCLVLLGALCLFPSLNRKVKKMIALAPAVSARNMSNFYLKVLGTFMGHGVSRVKGMYSRQIPLDRRTLSSHVSLLCPLGADKIGALLLSTIGVQFGMFGKEQVESSRMPQISHHWPSTTSLKTIFQMAQLYSDSFHFAQPRAYDYGKQGNLRHYGVETPPIYDLRKVTIPIAIFSSEGDSLVTKKDMEMASKLLNFVTDNTHIPNPHFSHIDFMIGKDADTLVFNPLVKILRKAQEDSTDILGMYCKSKTGPEIWKEIDDLTQETDYNDKERVSRNPEGSEIVA